MTAAWPLLHAMDSATRALADTLRATMATVSAAFARSDQRHWATRLDSLGLWLGAAPASTARAVLALYEGPHAAHRTVLEGDYAIDGIALTYEGAAVAATEPAWQAVLDFSRQRYAMYREALALWLAFQPAPPAPPGAPAMLASYGGGCEIWHHEGHYLARYDCGAHVSRWRDDALSPAEALHGLLGAKHFTFMVIALQARLKAAGIDPYTGSHTPLPEPPAFRASSRIGT